MNERVKGIIQMCNVTSLVERSKRRCLDLQQRVGACFTAPSERQSQAMLFAFGIVLLVTGMEIELQAQTVHGINYNDDRIREALKAVLTYLEGSFGALVMAASGIGAILSAAFGQYRASLGLMVVSIGAFILRSFMHTFFNTEGVE